MPPGQIGPAASKRMKNTQLGQALRIFGPRRRLKPDWAPGLSVEMIPHESPQAHEGGAGARTENQAGVGRLPGVILVESIPCPPVLEGPRDLPQSRPCKYGGEVAPVWAVGAVHVANPGLGEVDVEDVRFVAGAVHPPVEGLLRRAR